jgi:hypothetical protein
MFPFPKDKERRLLTVINTPMKAAVFTGGNASLRTWKSFRAKRAKKTGHRKAESPKTWKKTSARWAPINPARLVAFEGPEIRLLKEGSSGLKEKRLRARKTARARKTTPRTSLFKPDLDAEDAFAITIKNHNKEKPGCQKKTAGTVEQTVCTTRGAEKNREHGCRKSQEKNSQESAELERRHVSHEPGGGVTGGWARTSSCPAPFEILKTDGFVKSPSAALRFNFVFAAHL